jgi:four helix bundle protein
MVGCGRLAFTMFNFEKLEVWQKAIVLADVIYRQTRSFPADERFGLTNQMRRSVVSVSSNIAEGSSRSSATDFGRFVEIGAGSIFELVSQSFVAQRQNVLSEETFRTIYSSADEIGRMLSGLRASLDRR